MCGLHFRNELLPKTQEDPDLVITIETLLHKSIQLLLINGAQSAVCEDLTIFDEIVYECCRLLRNSCAVGTPIQNQIAEFSTDPHTIFDIINLILKSNEILKPKTRKMCWQFVANLGVQNVLTQRQIWYKCIEQIVNTLKCVCETENSRECTMILYNLCIGQILCTNDIKQIIELLLQCSIEQHALGDNDFHQLIMEYIITDYRSIAPAYDRIASADKQFYLISHIIDHMKTMKHQPISTPLLQFICKEFKKRSDYLLNVNGTSIPNTTRPQEVVAMLEVIALASSDERYAHVLATDHSLFINVGCLLRSIHKLGNCNSSDGHNIFTPIRKLGQFAPNPIKDRSIERDISYQLKSMLIRILANLAYKNKKNQDLVSLT